MANVINKATNKFNKGLVLDFSPENTGNEVLTHALNATLLTFNGNELSLQNDMGNGRVETAFLPEGYIPVGTCEYGGIIYIVSYNPLEDKSLIGCFPSPERNISNDELGVSDAKINKDCFQEYESNENEEFYPTGKIKNTSKYVLLKDDKLNPGDKFIITADENIYNELLLDLFIKDSEGNYIQKENPLFKISVVSIEDSGKIIYLDTTLRKYEKEVNENFYKYHILGENPEEGGTQNNIDIDSYRNILSSGYTVFKSKTSGKLAILAELITIDSYSVTHSIKLRDNSDDEFDIIIHTEVTPTVKFYNKYKLNLLNLLNGTIKSSLPEDSILINSSNYYNIPKLKYYYLSESQGYTIKDTNEPEIINLFEDNKINYNFLNIKISDLYTNVETNDTLIKGKYNFPFPNTYHGRLQKYKESLNNENTIYTEFKEYEYYRIDKSQVTDEDFKIANYFWDQCGKFYYYDGENDDYTKLQDGEPINPEITYYYRKELDKYINAERNEDYRNKDLFKLVNNYEKASVEIIYDINIEKFFKYNYIIYKLLNDTDAKTKLLEGYDLYIIVDNAYKEVNNNNHNFDSDLNYYSKEQVYFYESLGVDPIDKEKEYYYITEEKLYQRISDDDKKLYFDYNLYPYENLNPLYGYIDIYYYISPEEKEISYSYATEEQINARENIYYRSDYIIIDEKNFNQTSDKQWFISSSRTLYIPSDIFMPNTQYNKIDGYDYNFEENYPKDHILNLYTIGDFIITNVKDNSYDNYFKYGDVKLASIKIPKIFITNSDMGFPFTYNYTLVPCMNYGKLDHLATSNKIDFKNLWNFNASEFTTWKYRIDGNQLLLTFGAEIFDTFEDNKVDALILEFYDHNGFAGSYEIKGKKSYSGIFTILIYLNTIDGISKQKIHGNKYIDNFKHNVNINKEGELNETVYKYDLELGWDIKDEDNDCGILYNNLIYGVKRYFRRNTNTGYEFIHKDDVFLFTIPIYNNYYYTENDFNKLKNPKLDFVWSCRLEDKGKYNSYNNDDNKIINGYYSEGENSDYNKINQYKNGSYEDTILDFIKYYNYHGDIHLYLDLKLDKKYDNFNIAYDHDELLKRISGKIKLISDIDNSSINIAEGSTLNYPNNHSIENILEFNNSGYEYTIEPNDYHYLNNDSATHGDKYITINYSFVVGYKGSIKEIIDEQIQTGIVHALCYQKNQNEYNYEDLNFSVIENENEYKSNFLISVEGTDNSGNVKYCKQIKTSGSSLEDLMKEEGLEDTTNFSSGINNIVKNNIDNIGKYTFFIPLILGNKDSVPNFSYIKRVSSDIHSYIYYNSDYRYHGLGINRTGDDSIEDTFQGLGSTNYLYYSMTYLHIIPFIENLEGGSHGVFNTVDIEYIPGKSKLFDKDIYIIQPCSKEDDTGNLERHMYFFNFIKPADLGTLNWFNLCLKTTLKNVYVYDKYYNRKVNKGTISLESNISSFSSNLLFTNFKYKGDNINDIIGFKINNITINKYLTLLKLRSDIEVDKDQVKFKMNTFNLGENENYSLLLPLNFNFKVPDDITNELEYNNIDNNILIKYDSNDIHEIKTIIHDNFNKDLLYYYDYENNNLIELDISNYNIDSTSGTLTFIGLPEEQNKVIECNDHVTKYSTLNRRYYVLEQYKDRRLCSSEITLNDLMYDHNNEKHNLFLRNTSYFDQSPWQTSSFKTQNRIYLRKRYDNCEDALENGDWNYDESSGNCFIDTKYGPYLRAPRSETIIE